MKYSNGAPAVGAQIEAVGQLFFVVGYDDDGLIVTSSSRVDTRRPVQKQLKEITMRYCIDCLRVSSNPCTLDDCSPDYPTEAYAQRALAHYGYRINLDRLWFVIDDDEDNFREQLITEWSKSAVEAFRLVIRNNFPQRELHPVPDPVEVVYSEAL